MNRIILTIFIFMMSFSAFSDLEGKRLTSLKEMEALKAEKEKSIHFLDSMRIAILNGKDESEISEEKKEAIERVDINLKRIKEEIENLKPKHSDLASCKEANGQEKKPFYNLDLSKQFPKTYKQRFGNCWSYAGTSAIEAALARSTGEVHSYSPEYTAVCSVLNNELDRGYRAEELLDHFKAEGDKDDTPVIVDGGFTEDAIDTILNSGKVCTDFQSFENRMNTLQRIHCQAGSATYGIQKMINNESSFVQSFIKVNCSADLQNFLKKSTDNIIRKFNASGKVKTIDFTGFKRKSLELSHGFNSHTIKEAYDNKNHKFKKGKCDIVNNPGDRKTVEDIVQLLCQGHPLTIGVYLNGVELSNNAGKKIERWNSSSGKHAFHAMNIQGIEYDSKGNPYFSLRNSWKEGDEKTKDKSIGRIPFTDVCRILDVQYVETPFETDGNKVQRAREFQDIEFLD